jgi:hypothetical protein
MGNLILSLVCFVVRCSSSREGLCGFLFSRTKGDNKMWCGVAAATLSSHSVEELGRQVGSGQRAERAGGSEDWHDGESMERLRSSNDLAHRLRPSLSTHAI